MIHAFYRAYWHEGRDITDRDVVGDVLAEAAGRAGLQASDIERAVAANDDPDIKAELRQRTDEAVERGVFGAPTMFIHLPDRDRPIMLFGQDRLQMVQAVLAGWIPGQSAPPAQAIEAARSRPGDPAKKPARTDDRRPVVHFWYDFSSPFAYLGSTQIEAVAARAGAELRWRPMLLGAVFKQIGMANVPLFAMPESKRAYMRRDLDHWASYLGVPFSFASRFPQKTVTALRLALLAGDRIAPLSHALFRAMWAEDGNLEDRATLRAIAGEVRPRSRPRPGRRQRARNQAKAHRQHRRGGRGRGLRRPHLRDRGLARAPFLGPGSPRPRRGGALRLAPRAPLTATFDCGGPAHRAARWRPRRFGAPAGGGFARDSILYSGRREPKM